MATVEGASAGHQLGQVVGNWFEQYVALPLLESVAAQLGLYCDSRFKQRPCRTDKLIWKDADGNGVDYDFVFELDGTSSAQGIPVAFFETFWRRGSRHSKDKARDDSGKLLGMRDAYPTARLLGIVAAGDFTGPAQQLLLSRDIDLFYTSKAKIVSAWKDNAVVIDYDDKSPEQTKAEIAQAAKHALTSDPGLAQKIAETLVSKIGAADRKAFEDRVSGRIGATPQQYRLLVVDKWGHDFDTRAEITEFLQGAEPSLHGNKGERFYGYEVVFGAGDIFQRDDLDWTGVRKLHNDLERLVAHMEGLAQKALAH